MASSKSSQPVSDDLWLSHEVQIDDEPMHWLDREWLVTNGTGAYAMGTATGLNTRRYHGMLIACTNPPVGRVVALNNVMERLTLQRDKAQMPLEFGANLFRDGGGGEVVRPEGHTLLRQFSRGLHASWTYSWGEVELVRDLFVHWKQQAATIRYTLRSLDASGSAARLAVAPMLTLRDFHSLAKESWGPLDVKPVVGVEDAITASRGEVDVTLAMPGGSFREDPHWWYNLAFPAETQRGQDDSEDQFVPGWFEIQFEPGKTQQAYLTVALGDKPVEPEADTSKRTAHLQPILEHIEVGDEHLTHVLAVAADDFVVDRTLKGQKLRTILAGYPWFADWGRDTFIAFDGLLLCTGRFDEARDTLQVFAEAIRNGLIPNRFDDYDDSAAHYNTVDASLWFVHAAMRYHTVTGDDVSWDAWLLEACLKILDAYIKGTDGGIRMAGDGLITAGSESTQLTWMDAACGGVVFTPRAGKAVEINALWYNALEGLREKLAGKDKQRADHFKRLAGRARRGFAKVFWDDDRGYLADHARPVNEDDDDGEVYLDTSFRPNQIFVASLPHSPMPRTKQTLVVEAVAERLLTPRGLRTLPADDSQYHGKYQGEQFRRDEAYHQGTVWPWLIGPYAEAVLRTGKFTKQAKKDAMGAIEPLVDFLLHEGIGQLNEIHEGDVPHRPSGCIAQAWSVAEVLRVLTLIEQGQA